MNFIKTSAWPIPFFVLMVLLTSCSSQPHQPESANAEKIVDQAPPRAESIYMDGTFVVPGVEFSRYKKLIVADLDLGNIDVELPGSWNGNKTWALGEDEKRFFREEYIQAVVVNLIADGAYTTALTAADDVLLLKAKIIRIAPLSSENPAAAKTLAAYNESSASMTIAMELYDSVSGNLVGTVTDTRDLGRIWDENSGPSTRLQVNLAFSFWLKFLRSELDQLSRRQSPLEKLLID